jgi:hypothetical protein
MPKVPVKLLKSLLKKVSGGITEEMNTKHEEMIKAMRAKQVPGTDDVEKVMSKPKMDEQPAPDMSVDDEAIRPEIANMSKQERKAWLDKYMTTPDEANPFKTPGAGITKSRDEIIAEEAKKNPKPPMAMPEDASEEEALDTISKLMKSAKKKK